MTGAVQGDYARPASSGAHELAALIAFVACAGLFGVLAVRLGRVVDGPAEWLVAGAGAAAGALAADFAAGLVHWACDTFFAEDTRVLGPVLIAPFREHHRDPLAITRRGFLDVNSSNCFALVPLLAASWWGGAVLADEPAAWLSGGFLVAFAPALLLTNQFHKWAHAPAVPPVVRWLQRARCILPPRAHARHHRKGTGAYCVTFGWLNPSLDRLAFFPRLERVIRCVSRSPPAFGTGGRSS